MSPKMRAVDIKGGTGPATALHITDTIDKPSPKSGEALVKIKAFGLNRMDLLQREGKYPLPPQAGPILGVEFSGTIEALGDSVKSDSGEDGNGKGGEAGKETKGGEAFKIGDAVFGLAYGGAYAEYIAVSTHMLLHKPDHLSWTTAAGIPETWITATQALYLIGEFSKGKSVLWHAGASSVSIAGIQLSRAAGASEIYITAGSAEKIKFCTEELGATAGFNYKTQDWSEEILDATKGKGVDIVVDFVGATYFQGNLDVAARDGRIVHLGAMGGIKLPEGTDIGAFVRKRVRFEGSSLRSRDAEYQGRLRDRLEEYLKGFEDGSLRCFVERVFPWEEVVQAHEFMEGNTSMGKIICTID